MKRFMKNCAIAVLVLAGVGVALGITGRSVAGADTINQVVEKVTKGRVRMMIGGWGNSWGVEIAEWGGSSAAALEQAASSMRQEPPDKPEKPDVVEDTDWGMYCPGTGIRNLDINLGGGDFTFTRAISEDGEIYLEVAGLRKYQEYVDGGTLHINSSESGGRDGGYVILYVPEEYAFDEVEIEMGAGSMFFERLQAKEVSIEVGAGNVEMEELKAESLTSYVGAGSVWLDRMDVGELEVQVSMGNFYGEGSVGECFEAQCSMGNVDIGLTGSEQDFNYRLKGSMGSIWVGDNFYSGISSEKKINHESAQKTVDVDCSMGNITIWFTE